MTTTFITISTHITTTSITTTTTTAKTIATTIPTTTDIITTFTTTMPTISVTTITTTNYHPYHHRHTFFQIGTNEDNNLRDKQGSKMTDPKEMNRQYRILKPRPMIGIPGLQVLHNFINS
ncbi:hypothetical protein PoB_002030400 [Plakobranchus ocellatus]|uniref:Uncharacterized protein n=1 Tax=Plakobranchus ocellatus TaxID=259542 RepID=A0AAV3ZHD7_9GAST|nr:hypothetical protein PoB_002030400 [Plakobranchus ocellatus]